MSPRTRPLPPGRRPRRFARGRGRSLLLTLALHLLLAPAAAVPVAGQEREPLWIHASLKAGSVFASVPGDAPRAALDAQLELSHVLPMGAGLTAGYAFPSPGRSAAELAGPWAEATFAYRFSLRWRGRLSPYAGPLLGGSLHDLDAPGAPDGGESWLPRWHFGGRAGMDIPLDRRGRALRGEIAYRHTSSAGGLGGADVATVSLGIRWSRALP